jgi:hypothetical protein
VGGSGIFIAQESERFIVLVRGASLSEMFVRSCLQAASAEVAVHGSGGSSRSHVQRD